MSTVLFDTPGPKARARHNVMAAVALAVVVALLAWFVWRLEQEGDFDAEVWEAMSQSNIWRAYWQGLVSTLTAAVSAIVLAVAFGALFAIARLSDRGWVRFPARVVVEFFRAVPLLLLIMFIYFGIGPGLYWSLVIALTLYNGSVLAEVFRAGMLAVPKGQSEAAYAIGMRKAQVMRLVLMPQSIAIMLPAIVSQCVIILKDTALGQIVSYRELVVESQGIAQFIGHTFVPLLVAAIIFITINYSLSRLAVWLEGRLSRRGRTSAPQEIHDLELSQGGA
jgi:glutamate transport system permease protein